MVYPDNSSYNGDWQLGRRHGHGEYVMSDGSVYRGLWAKDKPHGRGTLSIPYISYTYSGKVFICLVKSVLWVTSLYTHISGNFMFVCHLFEHYPHWKNAQLKRKPALYLKEIKVMCIKLHALSREISRMCTWM